MSQSEKSSETVNEEQAQGFVEKVKMSAEEKLNLLSAVSTDLVEEVGVEEMTKIFATYCMTLVTHMGVTGAKIEFDEGGSVNIRTEHWEESHEVLVSEEGDEAPELEESTRE